MVGLSLSSRGNPGWGWDVVGFAKTVLSNLICRGALLNGKVNIL